MNRRVAQLLAGMAIVSGSLRGHHSISGAYDTSREITVSGIVTMFQFVNPHPFLTVDPEDGNRDKQTWRMEMDNRSELVEIGMNSGTLKPGDRVVVTGSPGRSQSQTLYIRRLDRPVDGLRYEQIGTTPHIQIPARR
jgi:Family of unknown function (DUF6152)